MDTKSFRERFAGLTEEKWWWLLLIMLLAGVVRLCIQQLVLSEVLSIKLSGKTDIDGWGMIARNLVRGKGYLRLNKPTATRGPVYPYFLYLIYNVFGIGHYAALAAQIFWNMVNCSLIYALSLELFDHRKTGLLAALGWALYLPETAVDSIWLFSEPLFIVLLLLFSIVLVRGMKSKKVAYHALAGALLGLTALCRPITQAFPLILLPVLFRIYYPDRRFALRSGSLLLICFMLVLSPWIIRNYKTFGMLVPASTFFGYNVHAGNIYLGEDNYLATTDLGASRRKFSNYIMDKQNEFKALNEAEQDLVYRGLAWDVIQRYPWRYVLKSFVRGLVIWFNIEVGNNSRTMNFLVPIFNIPILTLGIWGWLKFSAGGCRWGHPFVILIIYNTLAYMLILENWRFSIPMIPYLLIFGSFAVLRYRHA